MLITLRRPALWAFAALVTVPTHSVTNGAAAKVATAGPLTVDTVITKGLAWRNLGPPRGGRSLAVSGVRGHPKEGYFGATGGGLWKTSDSGATWAPVTDGQIHSASVGAVAVSESNPDIVYIGMGESCIRGNIMAGDGVYRSTDAGKSWTHVWGGDQQTISKIRIHPTNPNIVFVAAFGMYGVPNDERGVFKSTDGGKSWRRVLFRDNKTAAIDISIDRTNPQVMYAALWEAWRTEYSMSSGGPGSGLFKSTDGGETWTEITRNPGMPQGLIGKIGVSVSGADPNRVYAEVENDNGGLFRSDDAGATWTLVNSGRNIRQRAFYYTHVTADPHNKDLVYVQNVGTLRSTDGGKTMTNYAGGDSHDMWIDPDDSKHLLYASDGGGAVTYDALGAHAFSARDYPTAQLYHIVATSHVPYQVCGAQQDASTICVPTTGGGGGRGGRGGAAAAAGYSAGGAEPGYIAPDPKDPDIFYAGGNNGSFLTRLNRRTGEEREVGPYPRMFSGEPSSALVERWQWTYPIIFSPVDPTVLYASSQHVWKTTNGGQSWDRISPDLTRHDPTTMGMSGGPITHDMNGPEVYAVVFALAPSKQDVNVLWAGSDDGMIHVTRNGGKSWSDVTPKGMPEFGRVSIIDAGAHDAGTAYAAVKRPLLGDVAPYIFRTHDYGKTWSKVVTGLAGNDYVHVVREDPIRRGLLYAGTQHGVYLSYDDGDSWESLSLNLPDVPVSDLLVKDNSIAIATHGRSFYILDNIQPLREYTPALAASTAPHLFAPVPTIRGAGAARIEYWLKQPAKSLTIDILDKGQVVRSFAGAVQGSGGNQGGRGGGGRGGRGGGGQGASMETGINAVSWDLRYPGATTFPGMILWGASTSGPAAVPGTYTVRLTVDGQSSTQPLTILRHPLHTDVTQADLQEQFDLAIQLRDKVSEANNAVIEIRALKAQVADRLGKSTDTALTASGNALVTALSGVEEEIYQVRNQSGQDPLNFPIKLNNRLASLLGVVTSADARPIASAYPIFRDLTAELKVQTDRLAHVRNTELRAFNTLAQRLGLEAVKTP